MERTIVQEKMKDHIFVICSKGGIRVSLNPVTSLDFQTLETPTFAIITVTKLNEIKEIWIQGKHRPSIGAKGY